MPLPPFHPAHTIEINEKSEAFSSLSEADRQAIVHYVKHGDSKCSTCVNGFRVYWSGRTLT